MQRQWISRIALVIVAALVAGGVIAAARADVPPASQVDSNDGGAWLINASEGAVGLVNHAAMEVSTRVIVGAPKTSIYATQARGMVAVHNRTNATVAVVDESLNRVANQPVVPQEAQVRAVPGGIAIVDPAGGRAWVIGRVHLSEIEAVENEEPTVAAETPIGTAAG